jgi:NodT family efflux transporter outer membrane factor (OMF) lipoprotein
MVCANAQALRLCRIVHTGKTMNLRPWLVATLAVTTSVLAGCDVGPDYKHPVAALPSGWREANTADHAVWPEEDWWRGFGSPQLDGFIAQAETQNFDIKAAVARISEADAMARIAGAALLPSVNATSTLAQQRTLLNTSSRAITFQQFSLGADASYQIDFWGKNHAALEAAKATAVASRYDQQVIALATVSSVAVTYFEALALRDRIKVAEDNAAAAEQMLGGINAQFQSGTVTDLNIAQQQTVVNSLRALIPPLRQQYSQAIDALAILIGEPPENVKLAPETLLNLSMPTVAPGMPAALLERRPDVAEAEAQLIAANANIKVARADFLPSFNLTASGGMESLALAGFSPPAAVYGLAGGITAPIFEGGLLRGQLEFNKARYTELLADYRKSIVSALSNVEDGLAGVQRTGEQLVAETATVATARRAYEISGAQYHGGTVDLLTVLTAENALFPDEDLLVQVRLAHVQALVSLFQALGGGWQQGGDVQKAVAGKSGKQGQGAALDPPRA